MNRRSFMEALAAGLLVSTRLHAVPGGNRVLVVFLRGGYDAANVLVPVSSAYYYESRPNIAVPRESVLALDADWGLHPALADTIFPLWRKGQAAFVPFAGTEDTSRSHFETQDSIELGQPPGKKNFASGFMNRLAQALGGKSAIAFTDQLPVAFRGEAPVANVQLRFARRSGVDGRESSLISEMYAGTALGTSVQEGFAVREEVMREMGEEMQTANRNAISARGFGEEARRIARLMRSGYRLGFVDVGGWDTHVNEGNADGQLANRLQELGRGLVAFAEHMGPAWNDTVVIVMSEFGRTWRENGNRGTDHGHGTVYWLLGGAVRGGIRGAQVRLDRQALFQDRDYQVLNEYRVLLGGVLARVYGLNAERLSTVFPGAPSRDLGLV